MARIIQKQIIDLRVCDPYPIVETLNGNLMQRYYEYDKFLILHNSFAAGWYQFHNVFEMN